MPPTHQLNQPEIGRIDVDRSTRTGNAQSSLSDAKFLMYKSDANMDAALLASTKYTAAQLASMTQNDKMYAVSLLP